MAGRGTEIGRPDPVISQGLATISTRISLHGKPGGRERFRIDYAVRRPMTVGANEGDS